MSLKRFCDYCGKIIAGDNQDYISIGLQFHFCNGDCYSKHRSREVEAESADAGREKGRE